MVLRLKAWESRSPPGLHSRRTLLKRKRVVKALGPLGGRGNKTQTCAKLLPEITVFLADQTNGLARGGAAR